ncbi:uncharacterized protein LOC110860750 [Folsomia candida]|uniref:Uncharacterized protein n=1 Tax=Folsomia candida TaxID=158441 RepID=A0A226D599_FOLCA|nr:uncharacterized protein LOC110860750 [Folsomia candida]OXA40363.1 hypothetical protein Fcan01_24833 [Folsomia candida]
MILKLVTFWTILCALTDITLSLSLIPTSTETTEFFSDSTVTPVTRQEDVSFTTEINPLPDKLINNDAMDSVPKVESSIVAGGEQGEDERARRIERIKKRRLEYESRERQQAISDSIKKYINNDRPVVPTIHNSGGFGFISYQSGFYGRRRGR